MTTPPRSFPPPTGPPVTSWPPPAPHRPLTGRPHPAPHRPARTAHGAVWWLCIGWWWAPAMWAGRVVWWLVFWPIGLWRSLRHSRRQGERRARR